MGNSVRITTGARRVEAVPSSTSLITAMGYNQLSLLAAEISYTLSPSDHTEIKFDTKLRL